MTIQFRKSDFEQLDLSYIFLNDTSETMSLDSTKIRHQVFMDDGIVLQVPSSSCAQGHNILLVIFKNNNFILPQNISKDGSNIKNSCFTSSAKIFKKTILNESPEHSIIYIRFTQFDIFAWKNIIKEFKERQLEALTFISKTKLL